MRNIQDLKTLYIDDMSTIRSVLKKIFESLGAKRVEAASDATEAWEKIKNAASEGDPYDLILCDWHMPELDGIDLVGMLRIHPDPSIRDVRFIMITGNDLKIRQAIDSGVDNFIAKPFTSEQLKRKVDFVFRFDPPATEKLPLRKAG